MIAPLLGILKNQRHGWRRTFLIVPINTRGEHGSGSGGVFVGFGLGCGKQHSKPNRTSFETDQSGHIGFWPGLGRVRRVTDFSRRRCRLKSRHLREQRQREI